MDYFTFYIEKYFINALLNDDHSDLPDTDVLLLNYWSEFVMSLIPEGHAWSWEVVPDTEGFRYCEVCNQMGDTVELRLNFWPVLYNIQ